MQGIVYKIVTVLCAESEPISDIHVTLYTDKPIGVERINSTYCALFGEHQYSVQLHMTLHKERHSDVFDASGYYYAVLTSSSL